MDPISAQQPPDISASPTAAGAAAWADPRSLAEAPAGVLHDPPVSRHPFADPTSRAAVKVFFGLSFVLGLVAMLAVLRSPEEARQAAQLAASAGVGAAVPFDVAHLQGTAWMLLLAFAALLTGGIVWAKAVWHRQSEQAMRESEERLRLSQHIARVGTWDWNLKSGQVVCSAELCRIWRVGTDAAPGDYQGVLARVHHEDRDNVQHAIERCLEAGSLFEVDYQVCAPAAAARFVRTVGHVYRDAAGRPVRLIATVLDITEQRQAREALRTSEARFRGIFENMREGFLRVGLDGKIQAANPAALALLGYPSVAALLGKDMQTDVYMDPGREQRDLAELLRPGGSSDQRAWFKRADGSPVLIESSVQLAHLADGTPAGFEGIFRDVTAQGEYEEALRRGEAELAHAQRLARVGRWHWDICRQQLHWDPEVYELYGLDPASFRPSRESYMNMVHPDDRAGVGSGWGAAEAGVPVSRDHRVILPGGALKYVHLEAKLEQDAAGAPIKIVGIVQDVTDRVRTGEQRRAFMAALPDDIIHTDEWGMVLDVHAPRGRVFAVPAAQLLGHPLEATLPLEVWRTLYPAIARAAGSGAVQITECWLDNPHAPAPERRQCFEVRVAPVRDGGFVVIARDVTERKQRDGEVVPAGAAADAVANDNQFDDQRPLAGLSLLVVDDNEINRLVAGEMLAEAGAVVEMASSGQEALARVAAEEQWFDAVLMDIQMPVMDGHETTRAIRRLAQGARVPIIATTAHVFNLEVQRCLDSGMNDHVGKPIEPQVLIAAVRRWTRSPGVSASRPGRGEPKGPGTPRA